MTSMGSKQIILTYRHLLREINAQFTPKDNPMFKRELSETFRKNKDVKDPVQLKNMYQTAEDVLVFLRSTRKYKELLERYNPGHLDTQKKLQLAANRVGLSLPEIYKDRKEDENDNK